MRNYALDSIKGLAMIFILITHYSWEYQRCLELFFPYWIDMAVPILMVISGYLYADSYMNKSAFCLRDTYKANIIVARIIRFTVPFLVVFLVEVFLEIFVLQEECNIVLMFLTGGYGPGSYYYPIMIQFIFIFPLIFITVKRYNLGG